MFQCSIALMITVARLTPCICGRYGGTEGASFCLLSTVLRQLQHEASFDIFTVAKLYHQRRPGIWKNMVGTDRHTTADSNSIQPGLILSPFVGYNILYYWALYRVGQKEVHRDYRLVRLNGTCQIYDFLHKGSTEGGKTDASELGARRCEISRKIRFVSIHAFWPHHCKKL